MRFSRESYFIKAIENFLPEFAQPDIKTYVCLCVCFYQQNNNWASASRFFLRFLAVVALLRRETS